MFRARLCPSAGVRDNNVDYYYYSNLTAPNLQPTANQEPNDQCGNQHYSRELLMMGIVVPETC
jgi:hypothetical protein